MPEGRAGAAVVENLGEVSSDRVRIHCQKCGGVSVTRVYRKGFLQERIYPIFGYYPWRCMRCGAHVMLRKRYRARKSEYVE